MTRLRKFLRKYGPHANNGGLALVSMSELKYKRPGFTAYWPMHFIQLIGGKRWSLSITIYKTPEPILVSETERDK